MASVKVFLNRQEDADGRLAIFARIGERAYCDGDTLEEVYSYVTGREVVPEILADAFGKFNRGAPGFVGDTAYPQRSLSCGDVVEVDGVRYSCETVGWMML